ncbi:MAG: hypothetical protein ACW96U_00665 [Candidatus Heimdallarchaeaceae archaeon]|jgi:hypothetical protein
MKKHPYNELSDKKCETSGCKNYLKLNVVERKPGARYCYHCWYTKEHARRNNPKYQEHDFKIYEKN